MASRISLFNRNGLVDRSFIGGLTHESAHNKDIKIANRSLVRHADRDSQDKNFIGSLGMLDRFQKKNKKTAGSRDSVDEVFTHVYPLQ